MAIRNFLAPGTYTTVATGYDKQNKLIDIRWTTYSGEDKGDELASGNLLLDGRASYRAVAAVVDELPEAGSGEVAYIQANQLHVWLAGNGAFAGGPMNVGQIFYVEDGDRYVKWTGQALVAQPQAFDSRRWAEWFGVDQIQGVDAEGRARDLLRRSYEYLMSRAEFQGCAQD